MAQTVSQLLVIGLNIANKKIRRETRGGFFCWNMSFSNYKK